MSQKLIIIIIIIFKLTSGSIYYIKQTNKQTNKQTWIDPIKR